ncbi:UDP-N-acetylmuramoylalanyl-D-glutamate--2,6-diaminopimelate ligase [Lottiidibacillus patelloidae]|uniref:UDP-N-acetylmuramoyl-tripeptide--D-alanyl-D-alanine ligase n=1 Tax=Lottiidibacillus patelloidae TaxID=2670334 RepID=A0A263BXS1_9BACI|nr:UDP-N-acetylmuramoyl-tripeptide--D-alanyl-D-alanine ligase [Lottiidibacillus patelloidae]OZM58504.1 UDP-N-acetylmuramoylalanyl-D-glutamate--2,6-diaminopimelate ligase [Lottiidibacillus patelloidae]
MNITLHDCKNLFSTYRHYGDLDVEINRVATDTRKPMEKALFIPIVGERFNGHDYLKEAIHQGAVAALWQKDIPIPKFIPTLFPMILVDDTTKATQQLASYLLEKQKPIVVGVTGSNGKTTTKDLLDAVLSEKYTTHKTVGNFNNHLGLPFTVLNMPKECNCIILEMGMDKFGEIQLLSEIAKPDFAIITNIGESHIENLGSREGIAKAKLEITEGLKENGLLIVDGDEPLLRNAYAGETIYCGYKQGNTYELMVKKTDERGISFTCNHQEYIIPMLGEHNVKNTSLVIALADKLGLSREDIQRGLNKVKVTAMRLQVLPGKNGSLIINDAYNASPTSMKAAVQTLKQLKDYDRKIAVLGDMYELGHDEENLHRSVAEVIEPPVTDVFTVGEKGRWIASELMDKSKNINIVHFPTKEEAIEELNKTLSPQTVILFKASRGLKLETLAEVFVKEERE